MKKIIFTTLTLVLLLSGCGTQTPYEQLVQDTKGLAKGDALEVTVGSTIEGTDSDLDGTAFELKYTFDLKVDLVKMMIDDVEVYLTNDTMYMNLFNVWIQQSFNIEQYSELKEVMNYKNLVVEMPDGDQPIVENATGIPSIDQVISNKTLNDVVISTGENTYSITGVENILTIDTSSGLKISIDDDQIGQIYLNVTSAESIVLPAEAKSAINIDNAGNAQDGLVTTSEA